jgi:hypothetical protein
MRSGIVASSAVELSSWVGMLGVLLYRFRGVMLTVMYSVTGCVDRAASPTSFSRTQGISVREMFQLIERKGILDKTNHFEGLGVYVSHGSL